MAIIQEFDLNMIPDSDPVVIHVDQYDVGSGRLKATLYKGDNAYTPASGATILIQGTKPDKKGFSYPATISGNTVTANLTKQMTAVAGRVRVNLIVTEGSNRTGTFVFWLDVQATGLADDVDLSTSELAPYMDAAKKSAEAAAQSADDAADSALDAEAWAIGKRNGIDVPASDETYHNSSKYWSEIAKEAAEVPLMTNSVLGRGRPDGKTAEASDGIFSALGVAIQATVNASATQYGANWLTEITPDSRQMYRVAGSLYYWSGLQYVQIAGGGSSGGGGSANFDVSVEDTVLVFAAASGGGGSVGFGDPTISVDSNTGTPSASISATGPDSAKVFNFEFHNLKGEPGESANTVVRNENLILS